jgi:Zn-dependent M32 family carboxypeptidase
MDPRQIEIYQQMPIYKRVQVGCQLHDFAYQRLKMFLHHKFKEKGEAWVQREILKRYFGETAGLFY